MQGRRHLSEFLFGVLYKNENLNTQTTALNQFKTLKNTTAAAEKITHIFRQQNNSKDACDPLFQF